MGAASSGVGGKREFDAVDGSGGKFSGSVEGEGRRAKRQNTGTEALAEANQSLAEQLIQNSDNLPLAPILNVSVKDAEPFIGFLEEVLKQHNAATPGPQPVESAAIQGNPVPQRRLIGQPGRAPQPNPAGADRGQRNASEANASEGLSPEKVKILTKGVIEILKEPGGLHSLKSARECIEFMVRYAQQEGVSVGEVVSQVEPKLACGLNVLLFKAKKKSPDDMVRVSNFTAVETSLQKHPGCGGVNSWKKLALIEDFDEWMKKSEKLSKTLGTDRAFLGAITIDERVFNWASEQLRQDPSFILSAVKRNGRVLQFVSDKFKNLELVQAAVMQDPSAIEFSPRHIKESKEILHLLAQHHPLDLDRFSPGFFRGLPHAEREKIFLIAAQKDGRVLSFLPPDLVTEMVAMAAVTQNGKILGNVPIRLMREYLCVAAVQQNPDALRSVPESYRTEGVLMNLPPE